MATNYAYAEDDCRRYCQDGTPATRLVDLLPGGSGEGLRCTLRSLRLDSMPSYEALSYAWQDDGDVDNKDFTPSMRSSYVQSILVNNHYCLDISSGLQKALLALRSTKIIRTMWIDQLCIDQSDALEKNLQVAQMAEIYSKAENVTLWTGDGDTATVSICKTIEVFAGLWQEYGSPSPENTQIEDQFTRTNTKENYTSIPSLSSFFRRRVFTRGWIVQEIALAKRVTVKCGDTEWDWDAIASVARVMAAIGRRQGFDPFSTQMQDNEKTTPIWHIVELRRKVCEQTELTLLEVLKTLRHFETTDARDKVFAALGMCKLTDAMKDVLKIDYNLSSSEVFLRASKAIILGERTLGTFSDAGMVFGRTPDLPTWVSDWSAARTGLQSTRISRERKFNAAQGLRRLVCWPVATSLPDAYPMVSLSSNFAKIKCVQGRTAPKGSVGSYTSTIAAWCNLALANAEAYGGGREDRAALLRTLIHPFLKTWRSQGPVNGQDYESMALPGVELPKQVQHDYELDLVQVALQIVFNTDDDSYFYDFKPTGLEGVDKAVIYVYKDGVLQEAQGLPDGGQILTVEELADSFWVFKGDITSMAKSIRRAVDETVFFVTSNGYFGIGPIGLLENDEIHLVGGSEVPLVFRRETSSYVTTPTHSFVSECYVHGIMYGEALDLPDFTVDLITIC